jgi:hypothetical protein
VFWSHTKRTISKDSLERMREALFSKYVDFYAQGKVLNFTMGFLRYQAKLTFDQRLLALLIFGEAKGSQNTQEDDRTYNHQSRC